jgi:hypothetical protein
LYQARDCIRKAEQGMQWIMMEADNMVDLSELSKYNKIR